MRKVKTFEAFRKKFDSAELQPAKLIGVTDKWRSKSWSREDLVEKLGEVEIWPRDLREVEHTSAARLSSKKIRQFLSEAASEKSVFETRFASVFHAMEGAYRVPRPFQTALYTAPVFGLSRNGTGVGFHTANSQTSWGSWVAQVHGSTTWALRPGGGSGTSQPGTGMWPWPWRPALGQGLLTCKLEAGDTIFVPGTYARAWHGDGDANLVFGWQGPEAVIPELELPLGAITKGDVQAFVKAYGALSPSSAKEDLLAPCTNHAIQTGHIPILSELHNMGAKFDEEDPGGFTPLHTAASQGQAEGMRFALQRGADPKVRRQKDGIYPIHMAAYSGHVDALNVLLSRRDPGLKLKDRKGKQALHMTATQGHTAAASLLIDHRAKLGARDGDGFQPLHWASESNRVPMLDLLLDARAEIEAGNTEGETALYRAAIVGHASIAARLIERRARLDASTKAGRQAVHAAAYVGNLRVLEELHAHGAEMSPKSARGQYSPEGLAASAGHQEVLHFLQRAGAAKTDDSGKEKVLTPGMSISAAVQAGHVSMLDTLLEKLPDRAEDEYRFNLANDSLRFGHVPILEFLTGKPGNQSRASVIMLLPYAVTQPHTATVEFLLRSRAEVNKPPPQGGDPPLLLAAAAGHIPMVKTLLKHRAEADARSSKVNLTAMHLAVMNGKAPLVKALLKGGAQMRIGDETGREHLHVAAAAGHTAVVGALLDNRADVMPTDAGGAPPTFLAIKEGHQAVLRLLVERRADLSYKMPAPKDAPPEHADSQATALSVAAVNGHIPVLQFLLQDHTVQQGKDIAEQLGKQHGKDWQARLEKALELERRSERAASWKRIMENPEESEKMKQFSEMYRKLSPNERRALDKQMQEKAEREEAMKSHKEKQKKKRVSRPATEL